MSQGKKLRQEKENFVNQKKKKSWRNISLAKTYSWQKHFFLFIQKHFLGENIYLASETISVGVKAVSHH